MVTNPTLLRQIPVSRVLFVVIFSRCNPAEHQFFEQVLGIVAGASDTHTSFCERIKRVVEALPTTKPSSDGPWIQSECAAFERAVQAFGTDFRKIQVLLINRDEIIRVCDRNVTRVWVFVGGLFLVPFLGVVSQDRGRGGAGVS